MKVILIAALARNRVIGVNNTLPWKLSADLRRFKALTSGHTIVMGRKTFESLGRPLPGRIHVCVSRGSPVQQLTPDPRWPDQVFWCGDLFESLRLLQEKNSTAAHDRLYVIGGAEIYGQALAVADSLELTHIDAEFSGDAFFPDYENLFTREQHSAGEESGLSFTFSTYRSLRPAGIVVRPARVSDAEFIVRSQIQMALESEGLGLNELTVRKGVERVFSEPSLGEYLIAEHAEDSSLRAAPVACLLLQKEWSDWRNGHVEWMHSVFVKTELRRKGIFRWMYRVASARAKTRASLGIRLYVEKKNQTAQDTYTNLGMSKQHYDLFEDMFSSSSTEH